MGKIITIISALILGAAGFVLLFADRAVLGDVAFYTLMFGAGCLALVATTGFAVGFSWAQRIQHGNNVAKLKKTNELKMSDQELALARATVDQERAKAALLWRQAKSEMYSIKHDHFGALGIFDNKGNPVSVQVLSQPHWRPSEQPQIETVQPEQLPAPKSVLEIFSKSERLYIAGPSGSGKSTLIKWLVNTRAQQGIPSLMMNLHYDKKDDYGDMPIVGAGRQFNEILACVDFLYRLMDTRYKQAAAGVSGLEEFEAVHVIVDELTAINTTIGDKNAPPELREAYQLFSSQLLKLVIESRKTKIFLTLIGHSHLIKDNPFLSSSIRDSVKLLKTLGGNGDPVGDVQLLDSNLRPMENFAHPGKFPGRLVTGFDFKVPSENDVRSTYARQLKADGMTVSGIAREIFNVKNPGKHYTEQVRNMLNGTENSQK